MSVGLDIAPGRPQQHFGDLSEDELCGRQVETLRRVQLVFVTGPKRRAVELKLWALLSRASAGSEACAFSDDVHVAAMVRLWNSAAQSQLDVNSIGHRSASGLARM